MRAFFVTLAGVLSGCGGCGDLAGKVAEKGIESATGVKVDAEAGQVTIRGDEGTAVIGTARIPEDFPLPVVSDARVGLAVDATGARNGGKQVMFTTARTPEEIASTWETHLRGQGHEVQRVAQQAGDASTVMLSWKSGRREGAATLTRGGEAGAETSAVVHWSERSEPEADAGAEGQAGSRSPSP